MLVKPFFSNRNLLFLGIFFGYLVIAFGIFASTAHAGSVRDELCNGANVQINGAKDADGNPTSPNCNASNKTPNELIKNIINIFSVIVGIIAVIMVIIGAFKYITSGGDSAKVSSAKQTIIYALIGVIIVALAQFMVEFVLSGTQNAVSPPPSEAEGAEGS